MEVGTETPVNKKITDAGKTGIGYTKLKQHQNQIKSNLMLKNNLNGLKKLNRNDLKKVTGGLRPPDCTFACSYRINNGPRRIGCPDYEECVPYTCDDNVSIGRRCEPL